MAQPAQLIDGAKEEDSESDNLAIEEDDELTVEFMRKEEQHLRDELLGMKDNIDEKGSTLSKVFTDLSGLLKDYHAKLTIRENHLRVREYETNLSDVVKTVPDQELKKELVEKEHLLCQCQTDLKNTKSLLAHTQNELERKITHVTDKEGELTSLQSDLRTIHSDLVRTQAQLALKDTVVERLQGQLQSEAVMFRSEISRLKTALKSEGKIVIVSEANTNIPKTSTDDAMDTSEHSSVSKTNQVLVSEDENGDDNHAQNKTKSAADVRIKQEPIDTDEQILIQNNQTQQMTFLENKPVTNNMPRITSVRHFASGSAQSTASVANSGSLRTVFVQSATTSEVDMMEAQRKALAARLNQSKKPLVPDPDQQFACGRCGTKFIEWLQLQKHLETHTGTRPFKCKFCNKKFRQKYVLDTHVRTHTGEKPFKCEHCYLTFGQKSTLLNHMRTHTGEKPYSCEYCDRSFAQLSSLQYHLKTHEKIACEQCGMNVSDRAGYVRHKKNIHGIENVDVKPVLLIPASQGSPSFVSSTANIDDDYGGDTE